MMKNATDDEKCHYFDNKNLAHLILLPLNNKHNRWIAQKWPPLILTTPSQID